MRAEIDRVYSVEQVCHAMGMSRQAHYQWIARCAECALEEQIILQRVKEIRRRHPRMGGRKLHYLISQEFVEMGFCIGRDRFFALLAENDLLVDRRRRVVFTIHSRHCLRIYDNLIIDHKPAKPNQIWASDITYLRTRTGFCYLALILDLYSRMIIGWTLGQSLAVEIALHALRMALGQAKTTKGIIHHSDHGAQYCAEVYVKLLEEHAIRISMAAKGNPYENAFAERAIGILKDEYRLDAFFNSYELANKAVKEVIYLYNYERPHTNINYLTPVQKHVIW
ncbi:MAG: IS3 family transposase [candidate division Zixibacteria bacterium]|nr:IS3 family transposase [candidate division Zixibacteria bacterium]NIW41381.1 IS3 family transposase [candidate division Zixibacteria bacterium]NIX55115.1 IS3 family transposase [candidate division Zixibacteria bacterium]